MWITIMVIPPGSCYLCGNLMTGNVTAGSPALMQTKQSLFFEDPCK